MNRIVTSAALAVLLLSALQGAAQLVTYHFPINNDSLITNVPLNEISTRAFRNFVKCFGFRPSAEWRKGPGGYSVRFYSADSAVYTVMYSVRGAPLETHVSYTRANAPDNVRSVIGNLYTGSSILFVEELDRGTRSIFQIGLVRQDVVQIVEMNDGETKTVQVLQHPLPAW